MEIFEKLTQLVKARHSSDDPSHDFLHIQRVRKKCEELGEVLGARKEILIPAALLHDIVNIPKNHPDRARAADLAAIEAGRILEELGMGRLEIDAVLQAVREHSFSAGRPPSSLESAILQDADRLDAIGAIGIARTFACGTKLGSSFYEGSDPFSESRALSDKKYMLDHFFTKLFTVAETMNTEPAKKEAQKRAQFMRLFIDQFRSEVAE